MNIKDITPPRTVDLQLVETLPSEISMIIFSYSDEARLTYVTGKKVGSVTAVPSGNGVFEFVISLGEKNKVNSDTFRKAAASFSRWCNSHPVDLAGLNFDQQTISGKIDFVRSVLEGLCLGGFEFTRHKTRNVSERPVTCIKVKAEKSMDISTEIRRASIIGDTVDLARDWIHEPANIINPQELEDRAEVLAKETGLTFKVLHFEDLKTLGAGGITAVGRGSDVKPRLIMLEYKGDGSSAPVVLVGKAITFDTGGYSLKPSDFIQGMKYDKAGGVSVLATTVAAARLRLKVNLVALVPAAENMISGDAYRPDDILTLLSGLTVEIASTDAEGRLILADALTYAQNEYSPKAILDIATLTGGVRIALGKERAGLLTNSDLLADTMFKIGESIGEKVWRLPMDEEYFDLIKSDDADMKNSGPREASTIVGGIFLKQVVSDSIPWAHIDIAAMGEYESEKPWSSKGPNGFGIRLMLSTVESLSGH